MSGSHARGGGRAYEPVADIAKGGMGRVELVVRREGSFARIYAMKRLRPELAEDDDIRAMFLDEARIAGLIRHPNVVPVLDVGEDEQGPFLVMDYVQGVAAWRPLLAAAEAGERLPVAFCVEVARQAALGLAAAHELEGAGGKAMCVVHRDVSPQNILLGFDGLVRVTDFGVARILDPQVLEEGGVTGKVGYMSPEQVGGQPLDARSDLFSFGVVLYEMLAGGRLYTGERDEAFRRICLEPVPDVRAIRADVPEALGALVEELLAKSPAERPRSAREVAARLGEIAEDLRDLGQTPSVQKVLLDWFGAEHEEQRALVAAALEQTRAEISMELRDPVEHEVTLPPGADEDLVETQVPGPATTPVLPRTATREVPTPPSRRLAPILAAAVGGLLGMGGMLAWAFAPGDDPPPPPARGCDPAACRAEHGAIFYCDAAAVCRSAVSPICPEVFPRDAATDPEAIPIGTIFDRSTANQRARERAARLAVDGFNRAGAIEGRRVVLVHCDASEGATDAADLLVRVGVPAIIGPSTSSDTEAVFSAHADDDVLVISPSATAEQLEAIDTGRPGLLWRTAPPDSLQARVILEALRQPPAATSVAILRRANDVYAQSLSVILQESATAAGLRVIPSQVFADAAGIARATEAAAAARPDAVVVLSSHVADAAAFLDAAAADDAWTGTPVYLPDAAANDDLVALSTRGRALFSQVRATRPAAPSTIITSEFASEYMAAFDGEDPLQHSFTAHTYDAASLVLLGTAYALRDGGTLGGSRIAEGLAHLSSGGEAHRLLAANLHTILAALRSGHPDVDVVGASGPLDYDPRTEELTRGTYEILRIAGDPPALEVARRVDVSR